MASGSYWLSLGPRALETFDVGLVVERWNSWIELDPDVTEHAGPMQGRWRTADDLGSLAAVEPV
jgi:hypothetical protein